MNADFIKIKRSLETRQYAPVYFIDGEEPYYLDMLTSLIEEKILNPAERDFNLIVLYGKDSTWADVVNACRRFPMFAERQVVILKDAALLQDFNELANYLEKPSPSTVFLIEHRFKKADGRGKVVKLAKEKGFYFTSEKIKDSEVPNWIHAYGKEIGFLIGDKEAEVLASYLGSDLQRIANEIEKVRINVPDEKELSEALIKKYIGISRDYNIFEFPDALTKGDMDRFYRMLAYFLSSTKAAPMPLVIGSFYNHFNRLYQAHFLKGKSEKDIATALGTFPSKVKEIMMQTANWPQERVEYCLLLLGKYSTMSVGVKSIADGSELLKEMIGKMI